MRRSLRILLPAAAASYAAVAVGVLTTSPLVRLDWHVAMFKPYKHWPWAQGPLDVFIVAGQRGPTAVAALAWLGWRSWRTGSVRPMIVFALALTLLNASVGAVKLGVGRLGPHYAHTVGSAELFHGGMIFPSGHTANGVVVWGTLAYLAGRHRRAARAAAGAMALAIGLATVYLGTHWVSDVLGGWAAGALVLLALPLCEPFVAVVERWLERSRWPGRLGWSGWSGPLGARSPPPPARARVRTRPVSR